MGNPATLALIIQKYRKIIGIKEEQVWAVGEEIRRQGLGVISPDTERAIRDFRQEEPYVPRQNIAVTFTTPAPYLLRDEQRSYDARMRV